MGQSRHLARAAWLAMSLAGETCIASKVSLEVARMYCNHRIIRIDNFRRSSAHASTSGAWRIQDTRWTEDSACIRSSVVSVEPPCIHLSSLLF